MHFGFGVLRLAPAAFWAMSPRELMAAAGGRQDGSDPSISRRDLSVLMTQFPDDPPKGH